MIIFYILFFICQNNLLMHQHIKFKHIKVYLDLQYKCHECMCISSLTEAYVPMLHAGHACRPDTN